MINYKECSVCKEVKVVDDFVNRTKTVLRNECKECTKKLRKKQYEARKTREKVFVGFKTCVKCGEHKNVSEFRKHPSTKDGFCSSCKRCLSEYGKSCTIQTYLTKKKDSGRQKEILRKYRKNHSTQISGRRQDIRASFGRPIRMAEARMRSELRSKVHRIMGGKCEKCEEYRTERLCIDHVNDDWNKERMSQSGSFRSIAFRICAGYEWKGRYQLLCFNCNRKKQLEKLRSADKNDSPCEPSTKVCTKCGKVLPIGMFAKSKSRPNRVPYCKHCGCEYAAKRKRSCMDKLGGVCALCGETDIDVLEVDHINNDGAEKRKCGKDSNIASSIHSGKRKLDGVQALCCNCNAAKHYWSNKDYPKNILTKSKSIVHIQNFQVKNLKVRKISKQEASKFLNEHHYSGFGRSGKAFFGAFLENEIAAVAKFAPVVRKEVATSIGIDHKLVLELDRFCIHPSFQKKNAASFILSRAVKLAKNEFPDSTHAVSFADPAHGHSGTIYTAAGWKKLGMTSKSYCYVGESGNVVNKKTLYGRAIRQGMSEKEYAESNGYEKVETPEKTKFVLKL